MILNESTEFKNWLDRNAQILSDHTRDEIANLAIAAGLSRVAVNQWQTHQRFEVI